MTEAVHTGSTTAPLSPFALVRLALAADDEADRQFDAALAAKWALGRLATGPAGSEERIAASAAERGAQRAAGLAYDRADALRVLALTQPAGTLADAAAQLAEAFRVVCRMDDYDLDERAERDARASLFRILASTLPVVAQAAGLTVANLAGDNAELLASYLPGPAAARA